MVYLHSSLQNSRVCRFYSLSYLQNVSYLVSFFWSAPVLSNISLRLLKFDHNRPHAPIEPVYLQFLPPSFQEGTGRRKRTMRLFFKRCPWLTSTLLYSYLLRSVGTRKSLVTRNLNEFQETKPPLHLHSEYLSSLGWANTPSPPWLWSCYTLCDRRRNVEHQNSAELVQLGNLCVLASQLTKI